MDNKVTSGGIKCSILPRSYVHPESERPRLFEVLSCVPVIDLGCGDRNLILRQIGDACRDYGFFQVINQGGSKDVLEEMMKVVKEFVNPPVEEKLKLFSDDPSKAMRLSTRVTVKKVTAQNWRDIRGKYMPQWPSSPPSFKLQEAIAGSLGLHKHSINDVLGGEQGQHMAINYYPPCPGLGLTYGLPEHTDPDYPTILLQDLTGADLRVLKGKFSVKPCPDAFVINTGGNQLQALINCKTKYLNHITTQEDEIAVRDYQHLTNTSFSSSEGKIINIQGYLVIQGELTGRPLNILLDTGSSGSFINQLLVIEFDLPLRQLEEPVTVTVANGNEVTIQAICPGASWMIQGYSFGYGLRVMELRGYDIVLGTNWMSQFNPVTFDFDQRQITLNNLGNLINLQGVAR